MFPIWLSIILLILTFVSFLPQLHLIWTRKDASGISLVYVLFNLIAATEQFTLIFELIISLLFTGDLIDSGKWLNLAQTTSLLVLFLIYFALCLYFPSETNTAGYKRFMRVIYIAYFVIAIFPLLFLGILLPKNHKAGWDEIMFFAVSYPHDFWLNYIGTLGVLIAILFQARVILRTDHLAAQPPTGSSSWNPSYSSLSLLGLGAQFVLFIILAISWVFRYPLPDLPNGLKWRDLDWSDYRVLMTWYELNGSFIVDNAVCGVGQGILLLLALRRRSSRNAEVISGDGDGEGPVLDPEREPLLQAAM